VSRLAVRYVNRIDIPLPIADFNVYLNTYPQVAVKTNQPLTNFFMRIETPQQDLSSMLVLHLALVPPPDLQVASILLDIDLFRQLNSPMEEAEMWQFFDILRKRKNQIFEDCITDATRRLFN
jgi:uncharacterized protein (TIGR04255 family)